ncbi:MAG: hypothetical protein ACFFBP_03235 [Promethearchaeota archaeon]
MGFGKTFLLCLITYVGATFGGWVLVLALNGFISSFGTALTSLPTIAEAFFGPFAATPYPGDSYSGLAGAILSLSISDIVKFAFYIGAPLLAAIIAGIVGEKKAEVFGAWLLVISISMGVVLTLNLITYLIIYGGGLSVTEIINIVLGAVAHAFLYGCIALLVSKSESF